MKGNEILNKTGCLSPEAFEAARKDELKDNQWVIFDNHIKDCEICSDAYDGLTKQDTSLIV